MGQYFSKQITKCNAVDEIKPHIISKPIDTPKSKLNTLDPRSPTTDIVRTPIQDLLSTYAFNLNEGEACTRKLTYDSLNINHTLKTPVDVSDENSCTVTKSSLEFSFNSIENDSGDDIEERDDIHQEKSDDVTESKFSEIVQPLKHVSHSKGKEFSVGLLETNLDYVETDIDMVAKIKNRTNQEFAKSRVSDLNEPKNILRAKFANTIDNKCRDVTPSKDNLPLDPRSPSLGIDRTPIQIVKTLDIDPRSPTLDFVRTPIQIYSEVKKSSLIENSIEKDNCIEYENKCKSGSQDFDQFEKTKFKRDSLELFSFLPNNEDNDDCVQVNITKSTTSIPDMLYSEQVKSNNKISKNMIYEDGIDQKSKTLKQDKTTLAISNRTPLSDRNSNRTYCRSKSANGRFKEIKSSETENGKVDINDFTVGKIPTYRDVKKSRNKLKYDNEQSENIPPESVTDEQKKYRWDNANRTLVI